MTASWSAERVVDLNAEVVAIRRLRAAAMLPQFFALGCVLIALVAYALSENGWAAAVLLLCSAALFILLARSVERGFQSAVWLLTAIVFAMTGLAVAALVREDASGTERARVAAGFALMLTPCWILVSLGWQAHRSGTVSIRPTASRTLRRSRRERHSRKALGSFATAVLIFVGGFVPAALAAVAAGGHVWLAALVYWPIAALGGRFWIRGRRQSAVGVREIRKSDSRPPVLLLRSFDDDNLPLEKRYHLLGFWFASQDTLTLEGFVVDQLWRLGPVLAIGNPREPLNPLGAAREYIPDDRWRARIHDYLNESVYVVSILGATPGLHWEYQQIEATGKADRLLVVFPPRPAEELQHRWSVLQAVLKRASAVDLHWDPFIGVPLIAFFAADTVVLFYCKYRHETAYAAAFNRLFEMTGTHPRDTSTAI